MPVEAPTSSRESLRTDLDDETREAVLAARGPVCVLAGAGTGKSRSITRRIAYLVAGGPDPDFAETERTMIHALLTDVDLLRCFRARFPEHGELGYDEMVRRLGYVWDCPLDGTANVTGYRCAACVRTRESTQAETWS